MDQLVAVIWDDANVSPTDVILRDDVSRQKPTRFTTFGLLVREDDRLVSVAAEIDEQGDFRGMSNLPRGMVVEVIRLGRWPRRARKPKRRALDTAGAVA